MNRTQIYNLAGAVVRFWRGLHSCNRIAAYSLVFIFLLYVIAIFAPLIAPYDPNELNLKEIFLPPSSKHLFGTDRLGRDVFSRIIWGTRVSLTVGFVVMGIQVGMGIILGAISGYYGGIIDTVIMRAVDLFLMLPGFFLLLLVVAFFGRNIYLIMVIMAIISWPGTARMMRAQVLSVSKREFVIAAKATGASDKWIIFKHVLPNSIQPIIVTAFLGIGGYIMMEAGLSFLGLGDPLVISWGTMISEATLYLRTAWWLAFFPGLALTSTALAFNLFGDGLNDYLNPRGRR